MAKNRLQERFGKLLGERSNASWMFLACTLAMVVSGFAAYASKLPLLFPSLGPTAFLFFEAPMSPAASPRNTLIGHLVAVIVGGISLYVFGLLDEPSVLQEGVTLARVGVGALSVALTGAILLLLKASHPPSGATVLIVSLGFLRTPRGMISLMVGVAILTATGWLVNRAFGVPAPVWSAREARKETT